jgi:hypothetical protein
VQVQSNQAKVGTADFDVGAGFKAVSHAALRHHKRSKLAVEHKGPNAYFQGRYELLGAAAGGRLWREKDLPKKTGTGQLL